MKRIIASAGLVALGVASTQASTPGLTPAEQSKPWSVSLAVRGFYDDNYTTQSDDLKQESYGISVNPVAALNFSLERTVIAFNYNYDMRWYEDRESNEADHIQVVYLGADHSFSERLSLHVSDRFIYAQEGSVYIGGGPVSTPTVLMTDSDYSRNVARAALKAGLTEKLGMNLAYKNELYDYEQDGYNSRSALLDRMEQLVTLEGTLAMAPSTTGLLGYQLGSVKHSSSDLYAPAPGFGVDPSARDMLSHYGYAGIEHTFSPKLMGELRAGVQFADYTNADDLEAIGMDVDDSSIIPYVDGKLVYTYNPGSTFTLGVVNTFNQTDVGSAMNQESVNVYVQLNHRINPKWSVGATGMFQHSSFNGGAYDGDTEMFYLAGVNTSYKFSSNLSAEAGYNFDQLDSDLPVDGREYSRNRVFLGLRASF